MKLYNTLTRRLDKLSPDNTVSHNNRVKVYTCGLTVYGQPHIGNWIGYIYWDVLVRTLVAEGFEVERTQNYTDVGHLVSDDDSGEDKMEKGAKREGVTAWDVAAKYIAIADREAYELLALERPNHLVRATSLIVEQIAFVQELEAKGFTYVIPGEGVYYDTSKFPDYGKLAQLDIAGLDAGARVSIKGKRSITDFALWKFSPADQKRDMEWDSPWGKGFPGWHLECSVIARQTLGNQIDIHGGGIDHIPVHHTNEIAQTEAVTGTRFSAFWVHNSHLKVNGGKMSKSLGNLYTLQDIIDRGFSVEAYKLMVLSKHYRTEGNFTWDILAAAQNTLDNFNAWADLQFQNMSSPELAQEYQELQQDLRAALSEDLGTPQAVAIINAIINAADKYGPDAAAIQRAAHTIDSLLGLSLSKRTDITASQKQIIAQRQQARADKNWQLSDDLRNQLHMQGVTVLDTQHGTVWTRTRQ